MALPSTHWSLLEAVKGEKTRDHRVALDTLAARYRHPAYLFIRGKGYSHEAAEDLVQAFFADWLERELFGRADRCKGRFRSFFLTVLGNFLHRSHRAAHAQKRYPEMGFADELPEDITGSDTPEGQFWRAYASDLCQQVLGEYEEALQRSDETERLLVFRTWVVEPALHGAERPSLKALAVTLGLPADTGAKTVANMALTANRGFRRVLLERIREYAVDEADANAELSELLGYLDLDDA